MADALASSPARRGTLALSSPLRAGLGRRAIPLSVCAHLLLAAAALAGASLLGRAAPQEPQVVAQVELLLGTNAERSPPPPGERSEEPTPAPGVADAEKGRLASAVEAAPSTVAAEITPPVPPAPADAKTLITTPTQPVSQAVATPAPPAPAAPAKPAPLKAPSPAARPRQAAAVRQATAPTPIDAPGMAPTEPVPMPQIRLDDGVSAPPAEILDSSSRLKAAESDTGNLAPEFPQEAARLHEEGTVVLRLHIDPSGRVVQVEIVKSSGSRSLDRVSRERLATWHFRPALLNGRPVADVVEQALNFVAKP